MSERGQNRKLKEQRCAESVSWRWIYRLGSLRLALLLLLTVAIACAVATICESKFNRQVAEVYIYRNPFFFLWLFFLCVNLICSALTRWPWQRKHLGFVITHGGIVTLLFGAVIGHFYGFEASVNLEKGVPPTDRLTVNETVLMVQGPVSGQFYMTALPVGVKRLTIKNPRVMPVPESKTRLEVLDYSEHLVVQSRLMADATSKMPGVQLTMSTERMQQKLPVSLSGERPQFDLFGLAQVWLLPSLTSELPQVKGPLLLLTLNQQGGLNYRILRDGKLVTEGEVGLGESFSTGWLDWMVKVEAVYPQAKMVEGAAPLPAEMKENVPSVPGIFVRLLGADGATGDKEWVVAGTSSLLQLGQETVRIGFGLRTIRIPFGVELENFSVPRDEGTTMPANFISDLTFTNARGEVKHARAEMNHPASFPGGWWGLLTGLNYKFSQAGWDPQNLHQTTLQVLYDPGWLFKWVGSLLICVGIVMLFYFRSRMNVAAENLKKTERR